jgi:hypothetical protein
VLELVTQMAAMVRDLRAIHGAARRVRPRPQPTKLCVGDVDRRLGLPKPDMYGSDCGCIAHTPRSGRGPRAGCVLTSRASVPAPASGNDPRSEHDAGLWRVECDREAIAEPGPGLEAELGGGATWIADR